jgi:eukaryotic-like serine/threonine-protein kinase
MPSSDSSRDVLLEQLAAEFVERHRGGEHPPLSEYVARHPDLAADIRELFPALVQIEQLKPPADATGAFPPPAASSHGTTPERLGEYRIVREVGHGGMGVVYEAEQESLGRHVALKVLPSSALLNPTYLERFRREAKAAARLHHTNIVPVFGVGEAGGVHFYAMQFIRGEGLDKVLTDVRRLRLQPGAAAPGTVPTEGSIAHSLLSGQFAAPAGQAFPPDGGPCQAEKPDLRPATSSTSGLSVGGPEADYCRGVARLGVQVAEALAYAHRQGILHRDVKPSNLLLDAQGTVWVTDFGLAKAEGADELTQAGDIVGTIRFMAPERFEGKSLPQSDVYSLGVTLYELLTLRPAFDHTNKGKLIDKVVHEPPLPPRKIDPRIPRDLETVVLKCLAKEPRERYASAEAVAEDLRRFLADRPIKARRATAREHLWRWCRRNPAVAALLGAVATALLLGTAVAMWFALEAEASAARADWEAAAARIREGEATKAKNEADFLRGVDAARATAAARARKEAEEARRQADGDRQRAERERDEAARQLDRSRRHLCTAQLLRVATVMERDPGLGLELLHDCDACPIDLRDFAWGWYEGRCRRAYHTLMDHTGRVDAVALSRNGKLLASGSHDATIKLWDVATGRLKATLQGHAGPVVCVTFSTDGKLLASGSRDHTARLWEVATGKERALLKGHTSYVWAVAFSSDGKLLASGSYDNTIRLWEVATGRLKATLRGLTNPVRSVAFSGDGNLLASGDGVAIKLWELATGQVKATLTLKRHTYGVASMAFSGDGKLLASGGNDRMVKVWEVATGRERASLKGHTGPVSSVAFSGDGKTLASGSYDNTIRLWEVATGREKGSLKGHTGRVTSVALSDDGKTVAWGRADGTVKVSGVAAGPEKTFLKGPTGWGRCVAFSGDGNLLAFRDQREVRLWDVATGQRKATLQIDRGAVGFSGGPVAFSGDSKLLASAENYSKNQVARWGVKVWEVATGRERAFLKGHTGPVSSIAFSADGKTLASGDLHPEVFFRPRNRAPDYRASNPAEIKLWDVATGWERASLRGHRDGVLSMAFSADGKTLVAGSGDPRSLNNQDRPGEIRVWDVVTGVTRWRHTSHVTSVALSGDGKLVASGSWDKTVKLWEAATGQLKATLRGHSGPVTTVAFSGADNLLVSGSAVEGNPDSGEIRLWDAVTGQEKAVLMGQTPGVSFVAFSRDGKRLASWSWDNTIRLWDAPPPGQEKATLKRHAGPVRSVAFSGDGKLLVSGSTVYDRSMRNYFSDEIKVWDMATGQEKASLHGDVYGVSSVAIGGDGKLLAFRSGGTVRLVDLASGQNKASLQGLGPRGAVAFVDADLDPDRLQRELQGLGPRGAVAFSRDGKLLAWSVGETIKVRDVAAGQEKTSLKGHTGWVRSVAFSPDGKVLASGSSCHDLNTRKAWGEVKLWDVGTGKLKATLQGHTRYVFSVAFSGDGKLLASASNIYERGIEKPGEVKVWDVGTGRLKATLKGHTGPVFSVTFSGDGKLLACGGGLIGDYSLGAARGEVNLWDVATGRLKASLKGHSNIVTSVAFRSDGKLLASGSEDGTIKLWDVGEALRVSQQR